jgi:hypothetical protein
VKDIAREDLLSVLSCEIEARPPAPTVAEVAPLALGIVRTEGAVVVEFPESAREVVEAFAAAERLCCSGIAWDVERGATVTLRIAANEAALDVLESMMKSASIDKLQ